MLELALPLQLLIFAKDGTVMDESTLISDFSVALILFYFWDLTIEWSASGSIGFTITLFDIIDNNTKMNRKIKKHKELC